MRPVPLDHSFGIVEAEYGLWKQFVRKIGGGRHP